MIPVEQRHMAVFDEHGDNVQRGDCLTACIASIFELPIDEVPFFVAEDDWHGCYGRWVRDHGYQIGHVHIGVAEDDPTRLTGHPTAGIYWIATVKSPRGKTRCCVCRGEKVATEQWPDGEYVKYDEPQPCACCDGTGLEPSLHCVVMNGGELVWDPHPQRDMGHLGWVSGEWFIALDPARLQLVSEIGAFQRSSR